MASLNNFHVQCMTIGYLEAIILSTLQPSAALIELIEYCFLL